MSLLFEGLGTCAFPSAAFPSLPHWVSSGSFLTETPEGQKGAVSTEPLGAHDWF
jgi:hypothetical protein